MEFGLPSPFLDSCYKAKSGSVPAFAHWHSAALLAQLTIKTVSGRIFTSLQTSQRHLWSLCRIYSYLYNHLASWHLDLLYVPLHSGSTFLLLNHHLAFKFCCGSLSRHKDSRVIPIIVILLLHHLHWLPAAAVATGTQTATAVGSPGQSAVASAINSGQGVPPGTPITSSSNAVSTNAPAFASSISGRKLKQV